VYGNHCNLRGSPSSGPERSSPPAPHRGVDRPHGGMQRGPKDRENGGMNGGMKEGAFAYWPPRLCRSRRWFVPELERCCLNMQHLPGVVEPDVAGAANPDSSHPVPFEYPDPPGGQARSLPGEMRRRSMLRGVGGGPQQPSSISHECWPMRFTTYGTHPAMALLLERAHQAKARATKAKVRQELECGELYQYMSAVWPDSVA
jgi:hypothetical protein